MLEKIQTIVVSAVLVFATICFAGDVDNDKTIRIHNYPIEIYAEVYPEYIVLGSGICFALTFVNNQGILIEDCSVIFDSKYRANLNQLNRQNPETRWNYPKISNIPPKSHLTFEFSHDTDNDWVFKDSQGNRYSSGWGPPKKITIESSNHPAMSWRIEKEFKKPRILWSKKTIRYLPAQRR